MAKVHMKGYILCLLNDSPGGMWDYEISDAVLKEYSHTGYYWKGEVRAALADLFSGALVEELEDALDDGKHFAKGKILCKFNLTPFGKQRMQDTGLIKA